MSIRLKLLSFTGVGFLFILSILGTGVHYYKQIEASNSFKEEIYNFVSDVQDIRVTEKTYQQFFLKKHADNLREQGNILLSELDEIRKNSKADVNTVSNELANYIKQFNNLTNLHQVGLEKGAQMSVSLKKMRDRVELQISKQVEIAAEKQMVGEDLTGPEMELLSILNECNALCLQLQTIQQQYLMTGDDKYLASFDNLLSNNQSSPIEALGQFALSFNDQDNLKAYEEIKQVTKEFSDHSKNVQNAFKNEKAQISVLEESGKKILVAAQLLLDGVSIANKEVKNSALVTIAVILGSGMSLFIVVAIILIRGIIIPLKQCMLFANEIGDGNLDAEVKIKSKDESGMLAAALKDMAGSLRKANENKKEADLLQKEVQTGVQDCAGQVSVAVEQLAIMAKELNLKSSKIASESDGVSSEALQMSDTMTTVAELVKQSQENFESMAASTSQMSITVGAIAQNTEKASAVTKEAVLDVESASKKMGNLGVASKDISSVVETIIDISEQTKLLALNATIEASRAGESGKGFAVVASEVKNLAKQTGEATSDISLKIEAIHSSSESIIAEFDRINKIITDVHEIVSSIASAVEEQNITTQDIAGNISESAEQTSEVTTRVLETTNITKHIADGTVDMNENISDVLKNASDVKLSSEKIAAIGSELLKMVQKFN
jgi:methyl-accepting chemotaxis protein